MPLLGLLELTSRNVHFRVDTYQNPSVLAQGHFASNRLARSVLSEADDDGGSSSHSALNPEESQRVSECLKRRLLVCLGWVANEQAGVVDFTANQPELGVCKVAAAQTARADPVRHIDLSSTRAVSFLPRPFSICSSDSMVRTLTRSIFSSDFCLRVCPWPVSFGGCLFCSLHIFDCKPFGLASHLLQACQSASLWTITRQSMRVIGCGLQRRMCVRFLKRLLLFGLIPYALLLCACSWQHLVCACVSRVVCVHGAFGLRVVWCGCVCFV